jgi:cytoskeletal protein RodZ
MASFGPTLQQERQRRGISVDEVARCTRIARRYLLALEGESLGALPGGPYNRAYLRAYATHLGLDADRLLQEYDLQAKAQFEAGQLNVEPDARTAMRVAAERRASQLSDTNTGFRNSVRVGAASGGLLALLGAAVWFGMPYLTSHGNQTERQDVHGAPVTTAGAGGGAASGVSASAPSSPPRAEAPREAAPTAQPPVIVATSNEALATGLSVDGSAVGTDVVDKHLVGPSHTFAVGTRVAFWTLVTGGHAGDLIRHIWIHEGRIVGRIDLIVGNAHWRTYSRRTLGPSSEGDWVVEAQDATGRVLARSSFRCEPR